MSDDGLVRSAKIITADKSTFERPVQKLVLWCTYLRCRHVCTFLKKIPVRYVNLIPALQHILKFLGLCAGPLRFGRTKSNKILISTFLIHISSIYFRARKHNNQSLTFVCFVKVSSNSRFSPFVLKRAHSTNTSLLFVAETGL